LEAQTEPHTTRWPSPSAEGWPRMLCTALRRRHRPRRLLPDRMSLEAWPLHLRQSGHCPEHGRRFEPRKPVIVVSLAILCPLRDMDVVAYPSSPRSTEGSRRSLTLRVSQPIPRTASQ
jgi:hypothetical protein